MIKRMRELIDILNKACVAYYKNDNPIMTDKAYDELYDELVELEKEEGIVLAGSPTQKVQGYLLDGFKKVQHSKPMLSAAKTKDVNEIKKFLGNYSWYCSGKLDGCFSKDVRIKMADGSEKKIIDIKVGDCVLSYNEETKEIEKKRVINVFNNGRKISDEWIRIKLYKKDAINNSYYLRCTKNHKIYTTEGWKTAENLKIGEKVYRYGYVLSESQNDFLIGIMLGDGYIVKRQHGDNIINSIECHYSKTDKYPYNIMIDKANKLFAHNNPKSYRRTSGYGSEMIELNLRSLDSTILANDNNKLRCGITFTEEVLCHLTPLSLAMLYIDDGSKCSCLDDGYTCTVNRQVRCKIAVNRHPYLYVEAFSKWMNEHGYFNKIKFEKEVVSDNNSSGCYLELNIEGTKNFFNAVAPYIPKELRSIKLGLKNEWQECKEICWWENKGKYGLIEGEIVEITEGYRKRYRINKGLRNRKQSGYESYDLQVEDNHTYFANNYLVHNCTLVTIYDNGEFVQGITRGNGIVGEDVTEACRFIKNLPMKIPYKERLELRGECVMSWQEFNRINENLVDKYSHPRNLAAGTLRQLDLNVVKDRELSFVVFECVTDIDDSKLTELGWLKAIGFETVENKRVFESGLDKTVEMATKSVQNDKYPYDGLVFEINSKKVSKSLGKTEHHESCRMALKWKDDTYETVLRDVEWNVGKTGVLFPTGIVDPVDLDGAITSRVTLHNITYIKDLELGIGDTVTLYRSNMVIPAIDDNLTRSNTLEIPSVCPICGAPTKIVKENSSEVLYCTNDDCSGKLLGKWVTFVSKKGMDINGLSEATLEKFLQLGFLDHVFVNIYYLGDYRKDLYKIEGFGKKSIDNLLDAIEASRDVDLMHFLCAFSIPNVGEGQSKLICSKFKTFEEFRDACNNRFHFDTIPGIGPILNTNIHRWWSNNDWQMEDVAREVRFKEEAMNKPTGNYPLAGMTFVVTGNVHVYKNRDELKKTIESLGGKVSGSVSKNTTYLINNDTESTSSKNTKAKQLGVKIISEEDFEKLKV